MKLTVLGGGGVRSPFLAKSIAYNAHRIGVTEVVFMDTDRQKLAVYGAIAQGVFERIRSDIAFSLSSDAHQALSGADYIITTLRIGGEEGRIHDERIALNHQVLGQETTGAGGFAMAMRSIPAIIDYCRLIEQVASPDAVLFNFTNPSGMVTEAIIKSGFKRKVYGICDAPSEFIRELAELLGCREAELSVDCFGLNHLSWFRNVRVNGQEVTEQLLADPRLYRDTCMKYFSPELVALSDNLMLNEYLYYYYYREQAIAAIVGAGETRGEQIAQINRQMLADLAELDIPHQLELAFSLYFSHYLTRENSYMQRESNQGKVKEREMLTLQQFIEQPDSGGYAGVAIDILEAVNNGQQKRVVVSMQNNDTLDFLHPEDVIEISCELSNAGIHPVKMRDIPDTQKNLIAQVKEYERLAVAAILEGNRQKAIKALMVHPLVNSYSLAKTLVEEYLQAHHHYAEHWR
ncbi:MULTISPECIES: family 4 glycosyl hydrolase [unclassified Serratia (in: enterobacteria)]|uniref:family 4 glycosyl hydrolase n=1 Tax=unclassified Serratia (in: enterobacteria) TaxID=2647522 RepID=UPI002ED10AD9|nr:glycoside hydrolase [Serratia sp. C2(2)]MEE4446987.1 glycoside hydrolase [Serratia sp. C2(1)]